MPVRYPLLFSNIHSYRFLRKYPFIPSGYAISFYIERSLARTLPRRFTHKAAFCLFFPFPFLHSFDREQTRQPQLIHRTRRLSDLRPLKSTAKAALWGGRTAYPLVPFPSCQRTACFLSLMFFPASCRNKPFPVLSGGQVLSNQNPPRSVLPRLFRDRFLSKSSSLFRCKVSAQTGTAMRP